MNATATNEPATAETRPTRALRRTRVTKRLTRGEIKSMARLYGAGVAHIGRRREGGTDHLNGPTLHVRLGSKLLPLVPAHKAKRRAARAARKTNRGY